MTPERTLKLTDIPEGTILRRIAEAKLRFAREYLAMVDGVRTRIVRDVSQ